ncbi:Carboxymethylenebutenolidase-like protein [Nymphaea thermarum]|nr:Carboxymethylenebutenolidase-like protein [Nymphaea thermarum]
MQRKYAQHQHACLSFRINATSNLSDSQKELKDDVDEACELVKGVELCLGENDDVFHAYLLEAVKNNKGRGILLLSDIFGFQDSSTRDFAYRVACSGYNVLVPDLFRGDPWDKGRPEAALEEWIHKQSTDRLAKDVNTCIKWMIDEFTAAGQPSEKLGIVGFCFGGGWLLKTLANDRQGNFAAGVCFYGTRLNSTLAADVTVPVLFIAGDKDPLCPTSALMDIRRSLPGSRTVIYPGRGHGFAHRPESPEEDEDAEKAFILMRNWLHDELLRKNN